MPTAEEIRKRAAARRRKKTSTTQSQPKPTPTPRRRTASQSGTPPGTSRIPIRETPTTGEKLQSLGETALAFAKQPTAQIPQSQQFQNAPRGGRVTQGRRRTRKRRSAAVSRRKKR